MYCKRIIIVEITRSVERSMSNMLIHGVRARMRSIVGHAFLQLIEALTNVQEALYLQEQRSSEIIAEMMHSQEQKLQEALQQTDREAQTIKTCLEQRIERLEEALSGQSTVMQKLEERVCKIEKKMEVIEKNLPSSIHGDIPVVSDNEQLESLMLKLEKSVQGAVESVFPRMAALVSQMEGHLATAAKEDVSAISIGSDSAIVSHSNSPTGFQITRSAIAAAVVSQTSPFPNIISINAYDTTGNNLMVAVKEGNVERVRKLLDAGCDVNFRGDGGKTPLFVAFDYCHVSANIVSLLLERGANVNAISSCGIPLLLQAVCNAPRDVLSMLLEHGADINAADDARNTALHYSIRHYKNAALLVSAGADLEIRNKWGETPLFWAARSGSEIGVELLLDAGANINVKNNRGRKPFKVARTASVRDLLRP